MRDWLIASPHMLPTWCRCSVSTTHSGELTMAALKLERVLITDKTDPSCEEILKQGGIAVEVKLKLPKDHLLQEIQVTM